MHFPRYIPPLYLLVLCGDCVFKPTRGFIRSRSTAWSRLHHQQHCTSSFVRNNLASRDGNSNSSKDDKRDDMMQTIEDDFSMLDGFVSFYQDRWKAADRNEIRLDATVVACHSLARFLVYDTSLPAKEVPGMEVSNVIMVLDTFSSAVVLAFLWTVAGLMVRLFEDPSNGTRLVTTTLLAAPLWLLLERSLSWPTLGASDGILRQVVFGSLGLLTTMSLSRLVPKMLR